MKRAFALIFCLSAVIGCYAVSFAQDHRFVVFSDGKHGYINQEGKLVIPISLQGTYVLDFSEGLASFAERVKPEPTKIPYVDETGKLRLYPQEKWGYIDLNGTVVVGPQFDAAANFSEELAAVGLERQNSGPTCIGCAPDRHWGFIDKVGNMVIQPQYHSASSFSEGLAAVMNDEKKWGYIDKAGKIVIPFIYEMASDFNGGLAAVTVNKSL